MSAFLRFCAVGTLGFVVDAGIVTALAAGAGVNPYAGRGVSFLAAASVTWALNRRYTFGAPRAATGGEWAAYVALMLLGAAVNYGTYAALVATSPAAREALWIAVAAGSVAGLAVNFATSRRLLGARP